MQNSNQKEREARILFRPTSFQPWVDQSNEINRQIKLSNMKELESDKKLTTYSDELRDLLDIALKIKYGYEFEGKEASNV